MNETINPQETVQPQPVINQAPPPPQTDQTEAPPVSITEKKKKPILPIILTILLILALGAAGYFAYMYYQPQIPGITSIETTEQAPSPTPSPTPDPTESWTVIENSTDKFSFKCPPEWSTNDNKNYNGSVDVKECSINYEEGNMAFDDGIAVRFMYVPSTISNKSIREGDDAKLADINALSVINQENSQSYSQYNFEGWILEKVQSQPLRLIARKYMNSGYFEFDVIAVGNTNTSEWYKNISNEILSTFKYSGSEKEITFQKYLQSLIPSTWKKHSFPSKNITMYAPPTYKSSIEEFTSSSLIRFWQGESQDTATIQFNIKNDWSNTGNSKDLPKNFIAAGSIPTARKNSPKTDEAVLDRYISNYFFEYNSKVYSTTCTHNWIEKEYQTCILMLQTMSLN